MYRDCVCEWCECGDDVNDVLDGLSVEVVFGCECGVFEWEDAATRGDGTATTTEYV